VYLAAERGLPVSVFADETRPLLQGSPPDRVGARARRHPGHRARRQHGRRAAAHGARARGARRRGPHRGQRDAANKIGTYALALAARAHGVPFYVLAPASTFDAGARTGADIPIEERDADEVRAGFGARHGTRRRAVWNPAFDVTPAALITAIVSDAGVHRPPYAFAGTARGGA
jgi:methylthioribose-1-phosphate isomerase